MLRSSTSICLWISLWVKATQGHIEIVAILSIPLPSSRRPYKPQEEGLDSFFCTASSSSRPCFPAHHCCTAPTLSPAFALPRSRACSLYSCRRATALPHIGTLASPLSLRLLLPAPMADR